MEGRTIYIKGAYTVVRFTSPRASDGAESWSPTAKLGALLWTGTAAASVIEVKHAMASMDTRERVCIIKDILADMSLSECGRV